jgi:hypothetical protein
VTARSYLTESVRLQTRSLSGGWWALADRLEGFARLAVAEKQWARALRLTGAAAGARGRNGGLAPRFQGEWHARQLEPARRMLSSIEQTSAFAEGQQMPLEQAVAYALEDLRG